MFDKWNSSIVLIPLLIRDLKRSQYEWRLNNERTIPTRKRRWWRRRERRYIPSQLLSFDDRCISLSFLQRTYIYIYLSCFATSILISDSEYNELFQSVIPTYINIRMSYRVFLFALIHYDHHAILDLYIGRLSECEREGKLMTTGFIRCLSTSGHLEKKTIYTRSNNVIVFFLSGK